MTHCLCESVLPESCPHQESRLPPGIVSSLGLVLSFHLFKVAFENPVIHKYHQGVSFLHRNLKISNHCLSPNDSWLFKTQPNNNNTHSFMFIYFQRPANTMPSYLQRAIPHPNRQTEEQRHLWGKRTVSPLPQSHKCLGFLLSLLLITFIRPHCAHMKEYLWVCEPWGRVWAGGRTSDLWEMGEALGELSVKEEKPDFPE